MSSSGAFPNARGRRTEYVLPQELPSALLQGGRAAEFLVFIVLLRLLAWGFTGSWPDQEAWQAFAESPGAGTGFRLFLSCARGPEASGYADHEK